MSEELTQSEITAFLGQGSSFQGRLVFEGTVRIDGEFIGDVFSRDTLIIGPAAKVKGQITAEALIVAGFFEGEVRCSGKIEIQDGGVLRGDVSSPVLKIDEGGLFEGKTQMLPRSQDAAL